MVEESAADASRTILDFRDGGALPPPLLRRLDEVAEAQRDIFNSLIAGLTAGREHDIDWWVSRPASRNTHVSKLFAQCMQLALVRSLLNEGIRLLVQTDSPELAAALMPELGKNRVTLCGGIRWHRLRAAVWNAASALFHALAPRSAARQTRGDAKVADDVPISVLETFVYRDSFNNGAFQDFHYPTFYESLGVEQRRHLYYLPLFYRLRSYKAYFRQLRRADRNFLLREDHLRWRDYAFAFGHWWRVAKLKGRRAQFADFEVGPLVDADLEAGRFANSAIQALLNYRFLSVVRPGLAIGRYIDWYEGHDLDHAVAAAINWHARGVELIDLRPIAPESYLSVTPARHEVACGVVASNWGAIGGWVREQIARTNPELRVLPAPGLRHLQIRQFERQQRSDGRPPILVLLSQELELTNRLLTTVGPLLRKDMGYRWQFKRHPGMPKEEAAAAIAAWMEGAELVEGDLYVWLARAAVVVSLGSNTLIEAAAAGVPAICASSGNEPTEVPFSASFEAGWWSMCYNSSELAALLPRAVAEAGQTSSTDLKEALLGPFDASAMHTLLFAPLPTVTPDKGDQ